MRNKISEGLVSTMLYEKRRNAGRIHSQYGETEMVPPAPGTPARPATCPREFRTIDQYYNNVIMQSAAQTFVDVRE
jgi:hypothetical protein